MWVPRAFTVAMFLSAAALLLLILISILFFPVRFVFAIYSLTSLPMDLPYGISEQPKLEQNFEEHRSALETVVTTIRTTELTNAKLNYWGLTGYGLPELPREDYKQLRRATRQARIQRIEVIDRKPLTVRLITDEQSAMIDTNLYGYIHTADDSDNKTYGSYQRLDARWYLFEEIP